LQAEVAELRASRGRLVVSADADRRELERVLHDGVQQHLVALAVNLQHALPLVERDPAAATELLEEMQRDVQRSLEEATQLAQTIHASLRDVPDLVSALRGAAASARVRASVEVSREMHLSPEAAWTVYLCWLAALKDASSGSAAAVSVREHEDALVCDIVTEGAPPDAQLDGARDRVEALGGRLTVASTQGGSRVAVVLPPADGSSRSQPGRG
jgi:signal transduction histidine kinase